MNQAASLRWGNGVRRSLRGGEVGGEVRCAVIRTLAPPMSLPGATLGANIPGHPPTPGRVPPQLSQAVATSGDAWPCLATARPCLACRKVRYLKPLSSTRVRGLLRSGQDHPHAVRRVGAARCRRRRRAVVRRQSWGLLTDHVHSLQSAVIDAARPGSLSVARHAHRTVACGRSGSWLITPSNRGFTVEKADTPYLIRGTLDMRCAECLVLCRVRHHAGRVAIRTERLFARAHEDSGCSP